MFEFPPKNWVRVTLRRLIRQDRASAATVFALAAIPLTVAIGGGLDYHGASMARTSLQDATDKAALALVSAAGSLDETTLTRSATTHVRANYKTDATIMAAATYDASQRTLTVSASYSTQTNFLRLAGLSEIDITASSSATVAGKQLPVCVMITAPSQNHTLHTQDSSHIDFNSCMVQVNTQNWDAVESRNSSYIHSTDGENCFVGNIHYGDVKPPKNPSCTFFKDPNSGISMPSSASTCTYTNLTVTSSGVTLQPGTYCGITTINGGVVTFAPGVHIINSGDLVLTGNSQITAKGVSFVMTGTKPNFFMKQNARMSISPTTSGKFAGYAFYMDANSNYSFCSALRDGASVVKKVTDCVNSMEDNAQMYASGIVYFGSAAFVFYDYSKMVIEKGSLVALYLLGFDNSTVNISGSLDVSTSSEIAMRKYSERSTSGPRLVR